MSGLDKILEHIGNEASDNAKKIIDKARADADKILASEKDDALRLEGQIQKQTELDVAAAQKRIQSAADLKEKRMVLEAKQKEIDSVIDEALARLVSMEDAEYFAYLEKMLDKYCSGREGEICFSAKDLGRLPAGFAEKVKARNLTIGKEPVNIDGGFILDYGDIEENCSFSSLIHASREEVQDKIGQILFS